MHSATLRQGQFKTNQPAYHPRPVSAAEHSIDSRPSSTAKSRTSSVFLESKSATLEIALTRSKTKSTQPIGATAATSTAQTRMSATEYPVKTDLDDDYFTKQYNRLVKEINYYENYFTDLKAQRAKLRQSVKDGEITREYYRQRRKHRVAIRQIIGALKQEYEELLKKYKYVC